MTQELTILDGFDVYANDATSSPIRGINMRFKDGGYYTAYSEQLDVTGESYVVIDQLKGWQKLQKDCSPEYLMQKRGEPRSPQPHVDKEDWPLNLNGVPEHPWKRTTYLWLLNTKTGEISTFWTNTVGGNWAIGDLSDQVAFMRQERPRAMPVIALESRDMQTQYGGTKPRPHFRILGWRQREGTGMPAMLTGPAQEASTETRQPDQPAAKAEQAKTTGKTQRGVAPIEPASLKEVESPSIAEQLNDDLPEFLKE
jgi:hypothetical protein